MTITDNLLTTNPWSRPGNPRGQCLALVMHWTGKALQPARAVRQFFEDRKAGTTGYGSAHYVVDLDGQIIRCIPEIEIALHVGASGDDEKDPASGKFYTDWARSQFGPAFTRPSPSYGPNLCTLGIEMVPIDDDGHFRDATLEGAAELAADICQRLALNPLTEVTTHHLVVGWKDCPRLWVNHPELLEEFRQTVKAIMRPSPSAVENEKTGNE
jgi:N-acetylmuramoyl-L-alanine amidase